MIIAIPVVNEMLSMHFGHCEKFKFFHLDENKNIVKIDEQVPPPHEPGVLPRWLAENNVNQIIAGGMGMRAQQLFAANGINVIVGAPSANPEEIVKAWVDGSLETGDNVCDH
jgi:predicted Fe-Mo cluster-binding NifX family protein